MFYITTRDKLWHFVEPPPWGKCTHDHPAVQPWCFATSPENKDIFRDVGHWSCPDILCEFKLFPKCKYASSYIFLEFKADNNDVGKDKEAPTCRKADRATCYTWHTWLVLTLGGKYPERIFILIYELYYTWYIWCMI